MANTFLDTKISSFIEDKFPEFVRTDHPVFVEFLRLYYEFMESAKITMSQVEAPDNILLENELTTNFALLEDGNKIYTDDSIFGVFEKGETVTGLTSGATAVVLAEDNANSSIYIEQNRFFQVGEIITGGSSSARGKISKYQGNPVQTLQQLLEYADIDKTITDFLDQFRDSYLTAIPNTLASGVSKRTLVKNIRDLYRAKGTRRGHELFFRLIFGETPEIFYPRDNVLKISAGEWSTSTVLRVVATQGDPTNLSGQTITQTTDADLGATASTAVIETVLQFQEGSTIVFELVFNVDSIDGTFVSGATITGIDNANADLAIAGTVQSIITGANVTNGGSFYTTSDVVTATSLVGEKAEITIVDVSPGSVEEVAIDNPGIGYSVGQDLFFDNANTEGVGASAKITCVGGAIAPEAGDTASHTVTGNTSSGSISISNITTTTLSPARFIDFTGKVTTSETTITNVTTIGFVVGSTIIGTGIPTGATISSIDVVGTSNDGTITISAAANSGGVNGTVRQLIHLEEHTGQSISGTGIPAGSTIRQITTEGSSNNGTITIQNEVNPSAQVATANGSGVTLTIASAYGMDTFDHIVYEDATEQTDAYTGNQIQLETQTFTDLGVASEAGQVVNIKTFNGGSGYEIVPTVVATTARINWSTLAQTSTGQFKAGETITTGDATGTIAVLRTGNASIVTSSGTFAQGNTITGSTSGAKAYLTSVTTHGTGATFVAWAQTNLGAVKGLEVTNFGTGYTSSPTLTVPLKVLLTRNINEASPQDLTLSTSFSVGDDITGQSSSATADVVSWDQTRQILTLTIKSGTFTVGEILRRGSTSNYAILSRKSQASLTAEIGTVGTTAGAYENDKGKVSESLMKIQDSFYYQDFSYVVRAGAAIADWRGSVKKAVHPAGFAVFGEVSLSTRLATRMTTPITGITSVTPELASLFEAVITTIVRRKMGTTDDSTSIASQLEMKGTSYLGTGTLKRSNNMSGHDFGLVTPIESITRTGTTATLNSNGAHGVQVNEEIQVMGVTTSGYDGYYTVTAIPTVGSLQFTVSNSLTTPAAIGTKGQIVLTRAFDKDTRDLTVRTHKDLTIRSIYSGFDSLRKNRYGLGATQKTATKYLWATSYVNDSSPQRLDGGLEYAYPNITRRSVPETGTDNVTAGSAGVYDSTMNYTNIQIGVWEMGSQMTLDSFGDVRIVDIIRGSRLVDDVAEHGNHDDVDHIIHEDGDYIQMEEHVTIPRTSNKLWNVPPPSYIRGVNVTTGEYVSFDDNTSPPDFSDNTAPPSFDTTIGT